MLEIELLLSTIVKICI